MAEETIVVSGMGSCAIKLALATPSQGLVPTGLLKLTIAEQEFLSQKRLTVAGQEINGVLEQEGKVGLGDPHTEPIMKK